MDDSEDSKRDEALEADRKRFAEIDARLEARRPPGPPYSQVYGEIREAIFRLKEELVAEYGNYHGRDWRRQISHLLEQAGNGLHSEIEREKQQKRERKREARIAMDKAEEGKNQ